MTYLRLDRPRSSRGCQETSARKHAIFGKFIDQSQVEHDLLPGSLVRVTSGFYERNCRLRKVAARHQTRVPTVSIDAARL